MCRRSPTAFRAGSRGLGRVDVNGAETGDPRALGRAARNARFAGVAPRETSSGRRLRHRLDRRGNRWLRAALHRIAVTRARMPRSPSQHYVERRPWAGQSRHEARPALARHLARGNVPNIKRNLASDRASFASTEERRRFPRKPALSSFAHNVCSGRLGFARVTLHGPSLNSPTSPRASKSPCTGRA